MEGERTRDLFASRFSKGKGRGEGAKLQQIVARPEIEIMTQPVPRDPRHNAKLEAFQRFS